MFIFYILRTCNLMKSIRSVRRHLIFMSECERKHAPSKSQLKSTATKHLKVDLKSPGDSLAVAVPFPKHYGVQIPRERCERRMSVANDMQPKLSPLIPRPCLPELRSRMTCSLLSPCATSPCRRWLEYGKVRRSIHVVANCRSWYCFQAYSALAQIFCDCLGLSCYRPGGVFFLTSQLSTKQSFALMQAVHVISLIADPAVKVKTCSQRLMKSYVLDSQRCQLPNDESLHYIFQYLTCIIIYSYLFIFCIFLS